MGKPTLSEVGYVKRYTIGNYDPTNIRTEAELQKDADVMNREMADYKGTILGQEKNFITFQIGEHQVVMQYIVYHIGYKRKI